MEFDIVEAKRIANILIVSCHWGISERGNHTVAVHQQGIGHAAIDAGADLVLGHHQHAYQGVELYKGKIICHGLGNFIFDSHRSHFSKIGILFHSKLSKEGVADARKEMLCLLLLRCESRVYRVF